VVGQFQLIIQTLSDITSNRCWSQKLEVPLSYVVDILTDDYFVLLQYTRLTDRRIDVRELSQKDRALHNMQSRGKNGPFVKSSR